MKKLILFLLAPLMAFAAAGDIKMDTKNSSDTAWISVIFAKQNSVLFGTNSSGVPGLITNIPNGITYNGNTITTGTGILTLGAGKTTTFDHTSTFTTTDGQVYTFPTTSATIARTDAANTFIGTQTLAALSFTSNATNVANFTGLSKAGTSSSSASALFTSIGVSGAGFFGTSITASGGVPSNQTNATVIDFSTQSRFTAYGASVGAMGAINIRQASSDGSVTNSAFTASTAGSVSVTSASGQSISIVATGASSVNFTSGLTTNSAGFTTYAPSLSNSNTVFWNYGVSGGNFNGFQMAFAYTSSGSSSNKLSWSPMNQASSFELLGTGVVNIPTATASTSTATGALTVSGGAGFGGAGFFGGPIVHKNYTVGTLPTASTYTYGIVFVSDATNAAGTSIGTAPTGSGSVKRAVYSDGTNWLLL